MKAKKTKFREIKLKSGTKIILGRDEENNDELMKKFKGKPNIILHTESPGSPFGVIEDLNPSNSTISVSGAAVARYSQDWRDNKKDVTVNVFTGKDISKPLFSKKGTWKVKKSKKIKIKKKDVLIFENEN
tara:strand:- start:958 stop:1347 length:390 start_codon:yes stop_codon:yes gene_type:complete